jgi:Major Facilitator Superfamily
VDAEPARSGDGAPKVLWLTRGVRSSGLTSFFSDSGHEITTALLPTFVTVTLCSSAAALGLIEGISDALTGLAKLFAGPLANDEQRRLRMASGGYPVTAVATGAIGAATAVWQVGLLRAAAWLARGVRSPARDAMLASLAPREAYGRASGLERAGDNRAQSWAPAAGPCSFLRSCSRATGSGSRRRPSRRSLPSCFRNVYAEVASPCSAASNRSATSLPQPRLACLAPPSRRQPASSTQTPRYSCRRRERFARSDAD